jgi:hypothetical protein
VFAEAEHVRVILGALRDQSIAHHFEVLIYSFLPATLTLLIRGKQEGSHMKSFLAAFREAATAATAAFAGPRLWKRTYRERVLRKTEDLRKIIFDVAMVPVRAGLAANPLAYEFQGSFTEELSTLLPAARRRQGGPPRRTSFSRSSRPPRPDARRGGRPKRSR